MHTSNWRLSVSFLLFLPIVPGCSSPCRLLTLCKESWSNICYKSKPNLLSLCSISKTRTDTECSNAHIINIKRARSKEKKNKAVKAVGRFTCQLRQRGDSRRAIWEVYQSFSFFFSWRGERDMAHTLCFLWGFKDDHYFTTVYLFSVLLNKYIFSQRRLKN